MVYREKGEAQMTSMAGKERDEAWMKTSME